MNRAISPLKQAEDAVLVDSSEMGIEEVVESILSVYRRKVNGMKVKRAEDCRILLWRTEGSRHVFMN